MAKLQPKARQPCSSPPASDVDDSQIAAIEQLPSLETAHPTRLHSRQPTALLSDWLHIRILLSPVFPDLGTSLLIAFLINEYNNYFTNWIWENGSGLTWTRRRSHFPRLFMDLWQWSSHTLCRYDWRWSLWPSSQGIVIWGCRWLLDEKHWIEWGRSWGCSWNQCCPLTIRFLHESWWNLLGTSLKTIYSTNCE